MAPKNESVTQTESVDLLSEMMGAGLEADVAVAIEGEAAPSAPYFVTRTVQGAERVIYPTAYLPESVQSRCVALPTNEDGTIAHPFTLPVVDELLGSTGTLAGGQPRTHSAMAALFTHSGIVHPKESTVERSLCITFDDLDPAVFMSGTPRLVHMRDVAGVKADRKKAGCERTFSVPSHFMKCRISQGTSTDGSKPVVVVTAGARARFKERTRKDAKGTVVFKAGQDDVVWTNVACSARTNATAVARMTGTAKQVFNLMLKLSWLQQAREALKAAGSKTTLDAYHNAMLTVGQVYHGRPANSREDAKAELHATLYAVDDPRGVLQNAPAAYLWKGAELNLR